MKNFLKLLVALLLVLMVNLANAQIKVHDDGHFSVGTLSTSWDEGIHMYRTGWATFSTSLTTPWHIVTLATPGVESGKCWIVTYPGDKSDHRFYVTGYGTAYARAFSVLSDRSIHSEIEPIENAGETLDQINGIIYTPTDEGDAKHVAKRIGVDALEIQKAIPEAVSEDENGKLYVCYEALTAYLIEAVKEQRKEIERMHKILEGNGLLK